VKPKIIAPVGRMVVPPLPTPQLGVLMTQPQCALFRIIKVKLGYLSKVWSHRVSALLERGHPKGLLAFALSRAVPVRIQKSGRETALTRYPVCQHHNPGLQNCRKVRCLLFIPPSVVLSYGSPRLMQSNKNLTRMGWDGAHQW
jgi:hypothetical protein